MNPKKKKVLIREYWSKVGNKVFLHREFNKSGEWEVFLTPYKEIPYEWATFKKGGKKEL